MFEIIPEYISQEYENELIGLCKYVLDTETHTEIKVDSEKELGRDRFVRYGYAYDAVGKRPAFPVWVRDLVQYVRAHGYDRNFNAITINEYSTGRGISHHIDSVVFDDTIIVLSLGSGCTFELVNPESGTKYQYYLKPRMLSVMTGEERYIWTHSVLPLREDVVESNVIPRTTRYSIVFRTHSLADMMNAMRQSSKHK
jgi:alkylated DNA repair dioxygenase AlkB